MSDKTQNNKLSDRQEKFCQIKANKDVSSSEAYRRAGYSSVGADRNSSRLMAKDGIKARIEQIYRENNVKLEVSRELQFAKYEDIRLRAKAAQDITNEIRAVNGEDKLFGLSIDKTETKEPQPELMAEEREKYRKYAKWRMEQDSEGYSNNVPSLEETEPNQFDAGSLSEQNQMRV